MINDQSIVSTHQSSIFSHHAVITFFLACMQRRGNVSSTHISKNKKERAQIISPEARQKKGELRKVSKCHEQVEKRQSAQKLSLEERTKKESSSKSLNDIKKSQSKSAKN